MTRFTIREARDLAPHGLAGLATAAGAEGFGMVAALVDSWRKGTQRFDLPGEGLLAATDDAGSVVGVGGLTRCPDVAGAYRVRRFYVHPLWRRHGVARGLAERLIDLGFEYTNTLSCNAGASDASGPFWEAMGFELSDHVGITHIRTRGLRLDGETTHRSEDRVVIEIGCGSTGGRRTTPQAAAIGLDIDLEALRTPSRQATDVVVCADAMNLPLQSGSCDLVVLDAVLHHLTPTQDAISELARTLGPKGRLQITDGVALSPDDAAALNEELLAGGLAPEPIYGFEIGQLTAVVKDAGLSVVDLYFEGRATFATQPFVSRTYASKRFTLLVERPCQRHE